MPGTGSFDSLSVSLMILFGRAAMVAEEGSLVVGAEEKMSLGSERRRAIGPPARGWSQGHALGRCSHGCPALALCQGCVSRFDFAYAACNVRFGPGHQSIEASALEDYSKRRKEPP
jgi:hypothetical protein